MPGSYYVYILSNPARTLYIGVTSDLTRRIFEHHSKLVEGFSRRYNLTQLVYFEETADVLSALQREKQLKGWLRAKKLALIESLNPDWQDLAREWFDDVRSS